VRIKDHKIAMDYHNKRIFVPTYDGKVYMIGPNSIPMSIKVDNIVQVQYGFGCLFSLRRDGYVYITNTRNNQLNPKLIPDLGNVARILIGYDYILITKNNGYVYSAGKNILSNVYVDNILHGDQFRQIIGLSNIIQMSTSRDHVLALNNYGKVYTFGKNDFGQLGLGDYVDRSDVKLITGLNNIVEISASNKYSYALTSHGKVYVFGGYHCVPVLIPGLEGIVQISAIRKVDDINDLLRAIMKDNEVDETEAIALTFDGKIIKFTSKGIISKTGGNICEIYSNGKMIVQRLNNANITIDKGKGLSVIDMH
jgi:hypothetical protein